MKTLKILIALCIMLGFTTNAANAQAQTGKETVYWTSIMYPTCLPEAISGEITHHWLWNGNKFLSTFSGKLTGDYFGNVYLIKDMWTYKDIVNVNNGQQVHSSAYSVLIHRNGKPIIRADGIYHITFNTKEK
jgi:hypothetical protein